MEASARGGRGVGCTEQAAAAAAAPAEEAEAQAQDRVGSVAASDAGAAISKNALKRLRRQQAWEEGREERCRRRKERRLSRRCRLRQERDALVAQGLDPAAVAAPKRAAGSTLVPVAVVIDCDFESYMSPREIISLAGQVTRCYSDNRNARFRTHLCFAGWRGKLEERFRQVLGDQQRHWRGVAFSDGDFLHAAALARTALAKQLTDEARPCGHDGADEEEGGADEKRGGLATDSDCGQRRGCMATSLQRSRDKGHSLLCDADAEQDAGPEGGEEARGDSDVVYLTSDSPYTLHRLEPQTIYVIGGLVDRNREKGLCYRQACQRGVRTARLPIGDFMAMQSRQVLATNHVVEIILKWLECEDWGEAFMSVIPRRKGGRLLGDAHAGDGQGADEAAAEDAAADQDTGEQSDGRKGAVADAAQDRVTAALAAVSNGDEDGVPRRAPGESVANP